MWLIISSVIIVSLLICILSIAIGEPMFFPALAGAFITAVVATIIAHYVQPECSKSATTYHLKQDTVSMMMVDDNTYYIVNIKDDVIDNKIIAIPYDRCTVVKSDSDILVKYTYTKTQSLRNACTLNDAPKDDYMLYTTIIKPL